LPEYVNQFCGSFEELSNRSKLTWATE